MKKIIVFFIAVVLAISTLSISAFAEEPATVNETVIEEETNTNGNEEVTNESNNEFWHNVFSPDALAKIGAVIVAAIALILSTTSSSKTIKIMISSVLKGLQGKASKEEIANSVNNSVNEIIDKYEIKSKEIGEQYKNLVNQYNITTAILTVCLVHLQLPESVKAEVMEIITGVKNVSGNINEITEKMETDIKNIEDSTPKKETPALDEILKSQEEATETVNEEVEEKTIMRLE